MKKVKKRSVTRILVREVEDGQAVADSPESMKRDTKRTRDILKAQQPDLQRIDVALHRIDHAIESAPSCYIKSQAILYTQDTWLSLRRLLRLVQQVDCEQNQE